MIITYNNKIINLSLFQSISFGKDDDNIAYFVKATSNETSEISDEYIIYFYNGKTALELASAIGDAWHNHERMFDVNEWLNENSINSDEYVFA